MLKLAHVLYCQMMVKSEKCNSGLDSKCLKWNLYFNISTDLEFCCNFITIFMCNDQDWFDMRQKKNGFENYIWSFTSQSQGEEWVHYKNVHHWISEIN
jgi:hypothetical protein